MMLLPLLFLVLQFHYRGLLFGKNLSLSLSVCVYVCVGVFQLIKVMGFNRNNSCKPLTKCDLLTEL